MIPDNDDIYSLDEGTKQENPQVDAVHRLQEEALDSLLTGKLDDAYGFYDKLSLDDDAKSKIDKRSLRRFYMIEQHVDGKNQRQEAASKLFRKHWSSLLGKDTTVNSTPVELDTGKSIVPADETNEQTSSRGTSELDANENDSTSGVIDWKTCQATTLIGKPAHVSYQAFDLDKFGVIAGHIEELDRAGTGEEGIGLIPCREDGWPQDSYFSIGSISDNGRLRLDSTYANGMKKSVVRSLTIWGTEPADFHRTMTVTPLPEEKINVLDDSSDREYSSFLDVDDDDDQTVNELSRVNEMIDSLKNDPEVQAEIERQNKIAMDDWGDEEEQPIVLQPETDEVDGMMLSTSEPSPRESTNRKWTANWIAESDGPDGKPDLSSLEFMAKNMSIPMIVMNASETVWPTKPNQGTPNGMILVPDWIIRALTGRVMLVMMLESNQLSLQASRLIRDGVIMVPGTGEIPLPDSVLLFVIAPASKIAELRAGVEKENHED